MNIFSKLSKNQYSLESKKYMYLKNPSCVINVYVVVQKTLQFTHRKYNYLKAHANVTGRNSETLKIRGLFSFIRI